jgi:pimeloyl-ACP methyl ester carboxylesterase
VPVPARVVLRESANHWEHAMRHPLRAFAPIVVAVLALTGRARADATSRTVDVDGIKIHYMTAGSGEPVILLHGYAQSSRMWGPAMDRLAKRFTVIAPDLPGFGASSIPKDGLDVKTAATRIHALANSLHVTKARVVGHDIGLMVAYAYAAMYPDEVEQLVVMDAFLPGVGDWEATYHDPHLWHFTFHGPTPEALVRGRERIYLNHFWNDFAADPDHSVSQADRRRYTAEYSRPGRMRAGWAYFAAFPETARAFAELAKTKLTMPVLSIAGEKGAGNALGEQMKLVATNVTPVVVKGAGHWLIDERPAETLSALEQFLEQPARVGQVGKP